MQSNRLFGALSWRGIIIGKEGDTNLLHYGTALQSFMGVMTFDFCSDIYKLEVSLLAVYGHVANEIHPI